MANYIINGGKKLSGEVTISGSKNAAVALLCACLLNKGKTVLGNIPRIEEVSRMIEILQSLGVKIEWSNPKEITIEPPENINLDKLDKQAFAKTRAALMYMGVFPYFIKKFSLPIGGGCKLGKRTIAPYIKALEKLGVSVKTYKSVYLIEAKPHTENTEVVMYEAGDTATEVVLMAAALRPAKTVIKFGSANYQVQDTCFFLQALGVKIEGIGTHVLTVHGKKELKKNVKYRISEDPIEAMSFLSLGITTHSSITIKRCPIDFLSLELCKLESMGFKYDVLRRYKSYNDKTNLIDIKTHVTRLKALDDKIHAQPYPGINIDNLPFFVPIATQARGWTLIHDWVYEERAIYYPMLNRLGADIELADVFRAYINGPTPLKPAEYIAPPIIRNSVITLICMVAAKGRSVLRDIYGIERGYENLTKKLQGLGVSIEKTN